jgi:hypothetical protein
MIELLYYNTGFNRFSYQVKVNYVTTDGQSTSLPWCQAPIWGPWPDFYYSDLRVGRPFWGLSFKINAGPCHRINFRIRFPQDSWTYFIVSNLRFPQPGGPSSLTYLLQKQGSPVIPLGIRFVYVIYMLLQDISLGSLIEVDFVTDG